MSTLFVYGIDDVKILLMKQNLSNFECTN